MELIVQFFSGFLKGITTEFIGKVIGLGIGSILAYSLVKHAKAIWGWLIRPFQSVEKVKRALSAVDSESGLWIAIPVDKAPNKAPNCEVILVANLKGGVGKTTVSANLAAASAKNRKANTLCIDFDYQGSLTSMALPDFNNALVGEPDSIAGKMISVGCLGQTLTSLSKAHSREPRLQIIPADYPLAQVENRSMIHWLLGNNPYDLRTQLATKFQDNPFDRIIIDAPPRLTTSCVQGLFACTHIIIPTVLDRLSTEAVGRFVEQIYEFRRNGLCPFLQKISILGTMVNLAGKVDESEYEFLTLAMRKYPDLVEIVPFKLSVPDIAALGRSAGHEIAYLVESNNESARRIREIFDKLGNHLWTVK